MADISQEFDPNDETTVLSVQIQIHYTSAWSTGCCMGLTGKQLHNLFRSMQNPNVRCILMDQPDKRVMINVDRVERFEIKLRDPKFNQIDPDFALKHVQSNEPVIEPWQVVYKYNDSDERLRYVQAASAEDAQAQLQTAIEKDGLQWRRVVVSRIERVLA